MKRKKKSYVIIAFDKNDNSAKKVIKDLYVSGRKFKKVASKILKGEKFIEAFIMYNSYNIYTKFYRSHYMSYNTLTSKKNKYVTLEHLRKPIYKELGYYPLLRSLVSSV